MTKLTKDEKKILDNFKKSIPKLNEDKRNKLLIFSEAVAMLADRSINVANT